MGAGGVVDRRSRAPHGKAVISSYGQPGRQEHVGTRVVKSGQRLTATDRLTAVAECRWLKRPPALVPEIVAVCEPKGMSVRADGDSLRRPDHQLAEGIRAVHQIEEWEARIQPRCGKELKERAVR